VSKPQSSFDRAILDFLGRISGWTATILATISYGGIGLALPLAFAAPSFLLVSLNLAGSSVAGAILLGWLLKRIAAGQRRNLLEWTTDLRRLNSSEFEWLVGEVFRREGWKVSETGRTSGPDGNIDLILIKGGERVIVQCKRWTAQSVSVDEIRRFLGTLMREKLDGKDGIYVTLSDFNDQAWQEAEQAGLLLIDNRELFARIEKVRRSEPCPICGSPMLLNKSQYGWWLRCNASGCRGKRDLGKEIGRAVELLIQGAD
jgi:HJR/Mrr/RecB family endonuclease